MSLEKTGAALNDKHGKHYYSLVFLSRLTAQDTRLPL